MTTALHPPKTKRRKKRKLDRLAEEFVQDGKITLGDDELVEFVAEDINKIVFSIGSRYSCSDIDILTDVELEMMSFFFSRSIETHFDFQRGSRLSTYIWQVARSRMLDQLELTNRQPKTIDNELIALNEDPRNYFEDEKVPEEAMKLLELFVEWLEFNGCKVEAEIQRMMNDGFSGDDIVERLNITAGNRYSEQMDLMELAESEAPCPIISEAKSYFHGKWTKEKQARLVGHRRVLRSMSKAFKILRMAPLDYIQDPSIPVDDLTVYHTAAGSEELLDYEVEAMLEPYTVDDDQLKKTIDGMVKANILKARNFGDRLVFQAEPVKDIVRTLSVEDELTKIQEEMEQVNQQIQTIREKAQEDAPLVLPDDAILHPHVDRPVPLVPVYRWAEQNGGVAPRIPDPQGDHKNLGSFDGEIKIGYWYGWVYHGSLVFAQCTGKEEGTGRYIFSGNADTDKFGKVWKRSRKQVFAIITE